ncbi:MAG: GNAT family N-acetyltransferase [Scytonema hyalinum WJT4-NPBG1]|jgi:ribosomal protein S18 acetylase RimI-like enzyme|nr:GNAT family N-acetyltransferase [Scytonema hyalinum WJT4-NPBG1]
MRFVKLGENTEEEVVYAIESNMFEHMSYFPLRLSTMKVIDAPDLLLINSELPSDTFNFVCRAKFKESDVDSRIKSAIAYFQSRQLPMAWWISPSSQPDNLAERLAAHGLKHTEEELGMALDLNKLRQNESLSTGLMIRRVTNADELDDYAAVIAANWSPPDTSVVKFYRQAAEIAFRPESPIRFYIGYFNGEPVATSELFLAAGVAGIYNVATLEKFRKCGIGTAITLAALQDAYRVGYQTATLQASEAGKNIYSRLGFRQHCKFNVYQ